MANDCLTEIQIRNYFGKARLSHVGSDVRWAKTPPPQTIFETASERDPIIIHVKGAGTLSYEFYRLSPVPAFTVYFGDRYSVDTTPNAGIRVEGLKKLCTNQCSCAFAFTLRKAQ